MNLFTRFVLVVSLLSVSACAVKDAAAENTPNNTPVNVPKNVLFVGNSFTYYNNSLHNHYRALLRSALPDVAKQGGARIMTISGGQLPEHRAGLPAMLASNDWDVVILQGHSRGPIEDATDDAFRKAARDYAQQIRDSGAEPMFFMTWAYSGKPEMTALLDSAYSGIGRELGARVVPAGLAFEKATRDRPDIDLRIADGRHPSLAGTYLAACTFFAVLHNQSPVGIEYRAGLEKEVAAYLQSVAWSVVQEYARR